MKNILYISLFLVSSSIFSMQQDKVKPNYPMLKHLEMQTQKNNPVKYDYAAFGTTAVTLATAPWIYTSVIATPLGLSTIVAGVVTMGVGTAVLVTRNNKEEVKK